MAHRINERNTGHSRLDGGAKIRKPKGVTIRGEEKEIAANILQKVYDCMQKDEDVGAFTDGGRFLLMLDRQEMTVLLETIEKMKP